LNKKLTAFLLIAITLNIIGLYAALVWAPVELTLGESYRTFYLHVPAAWVCYLSFGISLIASILFLKTRNEKYDILADTTAFLGVVYASLTLVLGSIWANVAWGTYWNWDPRETTTLILWISYAGYLALRASIDNIEKRAVLPAIYNIFAFSTVPLSYISISFWKTLHPSIVSSSGLNITTNMIITLLLNLVASSLVFLFFLNLLYRIRRYERVIEESEDVFWR